MEVAGSLIAIGQAAAAVPTLIDTIRTFVELKGDLLGLHNEVGGPFSMEAPSWTEMDC